MADELGGNMLAIGGQGAVAAQEDLAAVADCVRPGVDGLLNDDVQHVQLLDDSGLLIEVE